MKMMYNVRVKVKPTLFLARLVLEQKEYIKSTTRIRYTNVYAILRLCNSKTHHEKKAFPVGLGFSSPDTPPLRITKLAEMRACANVGGKIWCVCALHSLSTCNQRGTLGNITAATARNTRRQS